MTEDEPALTTMTYAVVGRVARITLNRPERGNGIVLATPVELAACAPFLAREIELLDRVRVVVALGQIAWTTMLRCGVRVGDASVPSPRPRFAHGEEARLRIRAGDAPVTLLASYHPSRQNTNTGRLTRPMLDAVLTRARELAE